MKVSRKKPASVSVSGEVAASGPKVRKSKAGSIVPPTVDPIASYKLERLGLTRSDVKGGGDKWVKMATAMDSALDRMRTMYELIQRLQELHDGLMCCCAQDLMNWEPLLEETAAAANILKAGLKAR